MQESNVQSTSVVPPLNLGPLGTLSQATLPDKAYQHVAEVKLLCKSKHTCDIRLGIALYRLMTSGDWQKTGYATWKKFLEDGDVGLEIRQAERMIQVASTLVSDCQLTVNELVDVGITKLSLICQLTRTREEALQWVANAKNNTRVVLEAMIRDERAKRDSLASPAMQPLHTGIPFTPDGSPGGYIDEPSPVGPTPSSGAVGTPSPQLPTEELPKRNTYINISERILSGGVKQVHVSVCFPGQKAIAVFCDSVYITRNEVDVTAELLTDRTSKQFSVGLPEGEDE